VIETRVARSNRRRDLARSSVPFVVPLVLVAGAAVFFARPLFGNGVFVALDFLKIHVPFRTFIADAFADHVIPLWNPRVYTGVPFVAAGEAAVFYPLQFPFFLFSIERGIGVVMWLHSAVALLTTYAFCRLSLGTSRAGAAAGALVYVLNGYALVHIGFLNFIYLAPWVPLVFLAVERAMARNLAWILVGSLAVGLTFLAGQPQELFYALMFAPLWIVAVWARTWSRGAVLRGLLALAASVAGGLALGAVQVLPQSELIAQTGRANGFRFADSAYGALPGELAWKALLPDFGRWYGGEYAAWIGVVGLLLVAAGLVALARRGRAVELACWVVTAVVSYVLAFGSATPLYRIAYDVVPRLDTFRFPVRFVFVTMLACGALAAYGVDVLVGRARRARDGLRFGPVLAAAAFLVFVALLTTGVVQDVIDEWEHHRLLAVASTVAVGLAALGVALARTRIAPTSVGAAVLVGALALELFAISAWLEWNQEGPADFYSRPRALPAYIAAHGGGRLVPAVIADGTWISAAERGDDDTPLLTSHVSSIMGFTGGWPPRWIEPIRDTIVAGLQRDDPARISNMALLRLLDARWIIAPASLPNLASSRDVEAVAHDGSLALYRLNGPLRRARAYCGATFVSDFARARDTMLSPRLTTDTLAIEAQGRTSPSRECGRATIAHQSLDRVSLKVNLPQNGWLLLADTWYPGWHADVDGRRVEVERADAFFRAVRVPAGTHDVQFRYEPSSYRRGALISVGSWVAWLLVAAGLLARLVVTRRRRHHAAA
jgi:Bacterial membrane protein YfhO